MPVDIKEVEKELNQFLGEFYAANQKDTQLLKGIHEAVMSCWGGDPLPELAKIGAYLGNGEKLDQDLKALDTAMEQKLGQTIGPQAVQELGTHKDAAQTYFHDYAQRTQSSSGAKGPYSKLLTSVLKENEAACGFTPTVAVYLGLLSEAAFLEEARQARHFKDLISPQHGEFTHRIQWYLVSQQNFVEKSRVVMVYRTINMIPKLWDYLFDRLPGDVPMQAGTMDFRRPENLNGYLTENEASANLFPLLSSFLRARRAKRQGQLVKSDFRQTYAARKMFRKAYGDLTSTEKQKVDTCVARNLMVLGQD